MRDAGIERQIGAAQVDADRLSHSSGLRSSIGAQTPFMPAFATTTSKPAGLLDQRFHGAMHGFFIRDVGVQRNGSAAGGLDQFRCFVKFAGRVAQNFPRQLRLPPA